MELETAGYAATILGTVLGLSMLLGGQILSVDSMVPVGGVVVLAALGLLVGLIARE